MKRNRKTYRRQNRNSGKAIFIKTAACIAGIGVLMLIASTYRSYIIKEEKAPYLTVKEFLPELEAFSDVLGMTLYSDFINNMEYSPEEYITVKDVKSILQSFPKVDSTIPDEYKKDSWYIGLNDWNVLLLEMVEQYGGDNIFTTELLLLGNGENIVEQSGNILSAGSVLTDRGIMEAVFWDTDKYMYSNVSAVCYNGNILSVLGYGKQPGLLRNIYFSDASENSVHFFVKNFHIRYFGGEEAESTEEGTIPKDMEADGPVIKPDVSGLSGESIVDLQFDRGTVSIMKKETEYIHGKLLQVSDEGIEVEGYGIFKPDDEMEIYRLYSELSTMDKKDLRIGYAFTDFVLENGKVVACLMMKEEDMEYIRVLLKNSDYAGRYHESFEASCNQDYEVIYYCNGIETQRLEKTAEEAFFIKEGDLQSGTERIKILPKVLSAKTAVISIGRSRGLPVYSGSFEITAADEGLIVVNEVLLEDYLCNVVPSEMPSSYPKEALMAQAVCARTYAYGKMLKTGLPSFGAHVDDSAGFQVYNNIKEQASTTEAVKATHNMIAVYREEPIGAYYYSTSCGVGTDTLVWHGGSENPDYLLPGEISSDAVTDAAIPENSEDKTERERVPSELTEEENFREWIQNPDSGHFEAKEGWYRWSYTAEELNTEYLEEILQKRYDNNPKLILSRNKNGEFESIPIMHLGKIKDIEITKRLSGGVADELVITGTESVVKVLSELNIRYVLADGKTKVLRQSGDEADASLTLPSAFLILDLEKEDGIVKGYRVTGGGFGHGVGMSQNGAKNMAKTGMSCEEILSFFYPGTEVKKLQFGE